MSDITSQAEFQIMDQVVAVASGKTGAKIELVFYYTGEEERSLLYSDTVPKNFYENRTLRGELKNNVAEGIEDTPIDVEEWAKSWTEWVSAHISAADDARPELVAESVRALAEGTERVEVSKRGESRQWRVCLEWNEKSGEVTLTHEDMASGGYTTLKAQLFKEFAAAPEFDKEDWEELKRYWVSIQEETSVETMTEMDRVVESFVEEVKARLIPHQQADTMLNSKEAAWVDWDNEHGLNMNGHDPDGVVWVRSDLVGDVLDSVGGEVQVGELGGELQDRGITVRGSNSLRPAGPDSKRRYWFFDADAFGITEMDVHTSGDGDAPGEVDA